MARSSEDRSSSGENAVDRESFGHRTTAARSEAVAAAAASSRLPIQNDDPTWNARCAPQTHESRDEITPPPVPHSKKASKHRKRHIPVGPAGVWFHSTIQMAQQRQRQQQQLSTNLACDFQQMQGSEDTINSNIRPRKRSVDANSADHVDYWREEDEYDNDASENQNRGDTVSFDTQRRNRHHNTAQSATNVLYLSPAWTAAHCTLNLVTPSFSSITLSQSTVAQRSCILRRYLPENYVLFSELLYNDDSSKECDDRTSSQRRSGGWKMQTTDVLLCQVVSVQCDRSGTVARLRDEAGFAMTAWISPALVRAEASVSLQHRPSVQRNDLRLNAKSFVDGTIGTPVFYLRQGVVWLLKKCTIQLVDSSPSLVESYLLDNEYDSDDTDWIPNAMSNHGHHPGNHGEFSNRQHGSCWDRTLLVAEENIVQAWSSTSADQINTTDYIKWLEARNSLTLTVMNELSQSSRPTPFTTETSFLRPHPTNEDTQSDIDEGEGAFVDNIQELSSRNKSANRISSEFSPRSAVPLCALQPVPPSTSQQRERLDPDGSICNDRNAVQLETSQSTRTLHLSQPIHDNPLVLFPRRQSVTPSTTGNVLEQQPSALNTTTMPLVGVGRQSAMKLPASLLLSSTPLVQINATSNEKANYHPSSIPIVPLKQIELSQFAAPSVRHNSIMKEDNLSKKILTDNGGTFESSPTRFRRGENQAAHLVNGSVGTSTSMDCFANPNITKTVSQRSSSSKLYSGLHSTSIFNLLDIDDEDEQVTNAFTANKSFSSKENDCSLMIHTNKDNDRDHGASEDTSPKRPSLFQPSSLFVPTGMNIEEMFDD
jgi:hypothetical protein